MERIPRVISIFKENKYTKWYMNIIERRKNKPYIGYTERHHIIPKCINGLDNDENIVNLSAREHFICHLLLTKMHDSYKLKYALVCLCLINPKQKKKRYKPSSRLYEYVKLCNSIATSERLKGSIGYWRGKKKPQTEESKKKIGNKHRGRKYFHDPITQHVITIIGDEIPPIGYVKGNPKANTSMYTTLKGNTYFHNPTSGEEVRSDNCPIGWNKGRSYIFITNGIESKLINKITNSIPDGWYKGRSMDWTRNRKKK